MNTDKISNSEIETFSQIHRGALDKVFPVFVWIFAIAACVAGGYAVAIAHYPASMRFAPGFYEAAALSACVVMMFFWVIFLCLWVVAFFGIIPKLLRRHALYPALRTWGRYGLMVVLGGVVCALCVYENFREGFTPSFITEPVKAFHELSLPSTEMEDEDFVMPEPEDRVRNLFMRK